MNPAIQRLVDALVDLPPAQCEQFVAEVLAHLAQQQPSDGASLPAPEAKRSQAELQAAFDILCGLTRDEPLILDNIRASQWAARPEKP